MFLVYSTYTEIGFGVISQLTGYSTLEEARAFVATLIAEKTNKDPNYKIIEGLIVETG